jgi:hypothetical protein
MTVVVQTRLDEGRLSKLESIKAKTGFNTSQLFRKLIDCVEVEPATITINFGQAKSDVNIRQDSHVAFAG